MDASLRDFVTRRSVGRCEYCRLPQKFFTELFQVEHIISRQHRGQTVESNLAIACARCNLHKGQTSLELIRSMVKLFALSSES